MGELDQLINGMHDMLIECEMPDNRKKRFEARYQSVAGHAPDKKFVQTQDNKWGIEYRIYFNATSVIIAGLIDAGFHIEDRGAGYRAEYKHRINDEELFWELIGRGYHLGHN